MTASRLRSVGLLVSLFVALMLGSALVWAAGAQSKPTPEDRTASIQLLGVNDFHGNLEPPATRVGGRPVGGAAYLDAYLNEYEAKNPGAPSGFTPATWSGPPRSSPATSMMSPPSTP